MSTKAEQFKAKLVTLLGSLGQQSDVTSISIEVVDAEVNTVLVSNQGIGIDVGWPIELRSITGKRIVPGYRVFYLKVHPASRWHPEEVEDVTSLETDGEHDALVAVGTLIVKNVVRDIAECTIPEF